MNSWHTSDKFQRPLRSAISHCWVLGTPRSQKDKKPKIQYAMANTGHSYPFKWITNDTYIPEMTSTERLWIPWTIAEHWELQEVRKAKYRKWNLQWKGRSMPSILADGMNRLNTSSAVWRTLMNDLTRSQTVGLVGGDRWKSENKTCNGNTGH